jgi:hypothetical protein
MILRATAVWALLLVIAILNGGVREGWITPRWGSRTGHIASTLMLAALIFLTAWLSVRWLRLSTPAGAVRVGILWLVLTLAFEFLGGHYLFRRSWASLWAEYDLSQGRIWVLVPLVTFLAPLLAGYLRGLFR